MFIGEFTHALDIKGRVAVPSTFRTKLGNSAVLTRGLDGALFLYTKEDWQIFMEKIAQLPISHEQSRAFSRHVLSGAIEVEPDAQGRIMIPAYLREFAFSGKTVVFAGLNNRIEIWDETKWRAYQSQTAAMASELVAGLTPFGI